MTADYDVFATGATAVFQIDGTSGGTLVDISEAVNSVSRSGTKELKEVKRIGNNQTVKVAGPAATDWKVKIWANKDTIAIFDSESMTSGTAARSVEWAPFGTDSGQTKYTGEVIIGALTWDTNPDDPQSFEAPLSFTGAGVTIGSYS